MLFDKQLTKKDSAVRVAEKTIIGRIRQHIECAYAYNTLPAAMARGSIVSLYQQVDAGHVVRKTQSAVDLQYMGVLEGDLAAAALPANPTVASCRHDGLAFVLMDTGLDPHVGDPVWATFDAAGGYGILVYAPGAVYVGTVEDITGYNAAAAAGTSGLQVLLKHAYEPER